MLTYAEELIQEGHRRGKIEGKIEGKLEGKIEGKVQTIESLLAVGADWSLITLGTGITPEDFERLKVELRRSDTSSSGESQ